VNLKPKLASNGATGWTAEECSTRALRALTVRDIDEETQKKSATALLKHRPKFGLLLDEATFVV
jgi:hypothetical protein